LGKATSARTWKRGGTLNKSSRLCNHGTAVLDERNNDDVKRASPSFGAAH